MALNICNLHEKNAIKLEGIEQLKESLNSYYVIQMYICAYMHDAYTHACKWGWVIPSLTQLVYQHMNWFFFRNMNYFNVRGQKSILVKIIHTYKHTHQLLVRPPDCLVFFSSSCHSLLLLGLQAQTTMPALFSLLFFKNCVCTYMPHIRHACTHAMHVHMHTD